MCKVQCARIAAFLYFSLRRLGLCLSLTHSLLWDPCPYSIYLGCYMQDSQVLAGYNMLLPMSLNTFYSIIDWLFILSVDSIGNPPKKQQHKNWCLYSVSNIIKCNDNKRRVAKLLHVSYQTLPEQLRRTDLTLSVPLYGSHLLYSTLKAFFLILLCKNV